MDTSGRDTNGEDTLGNRKCSHLPVPLPTGKKLDMTMSHLRSRGEENTREYEVKK